MSCCCPSALLHPLLLDTEGLSRKEAALASMQAELEALKSTASRMLQLEAELAASNTHLAAMNEEVDLARTASKRIE